MVKKITIFAALIAGLILLIHNVYHYPVNAGYDAVLHMRYAKIVSFEWRIPKYSETAENYNPPLFYLVSGLVGRVAGYLNRPGLFLPPLRLGNMRVFCFQSAVSFYGLRSLNI